MTFSVPKCVSMMVLIGGDPRVIGAHDTAVSIALQEVQALVSARLTVDEVTAFSGYRARGSPGRHRRTPAP